MSSILLPIFFVLPAPFKIALVMFSGLSYVAFEVQHKAAVEEVQELKVVPANQADEE